MRAIVVSAVAAVAMMGRGTLALRAGPRRWLARGVGAGGVLATLRPGKVAQAENLGVGGAASAVRGFAGATKVRLFGLFGGGEVPTDGEADYYPALKGIAKEAVDFAIMGQPQPKKSERASKAAGKDMHVATFAGGCFWGPQLHFDRVEGVEDSSVGYIANGMELEPMARPTYQWVCTGSSGHTEGVQVVYDPDVVSYEQLLNAFFGFTDATQAGGHGNDRGPQYITAVYYHDDEQKAVADKVFAELNKKYKGNVGTKLMPASPYWSAEPYHQNYLERGGRFGAKQSAEKGATDKVRCYG